MERAMRGDHAAFAELIGARIGRLYGAAALMTGDPMTAEDAVQAGLILAWRDLPRLREPARFDAWVRRIVINACRDDLRRRRRHPSTPLTDAFDRSVPDAFHATAARDEIQRGLARVTDDQRAILTLRFYLDLPLDEIASVLSIPLGTVKSRLSRATDALRAELDANARSATRQGAS